MGNAQPDTSFNAQPYVRPGITHEEVLGLRNVFLSLDPQNGLIETATLKRQFKESHDAPTLNCEIGNRNVLNFDQFYEIMSKNIIEKKQKFKGDVQFEDTSEQATCLFCPQSRPQRSSSTI